MDSPVSKYSTKKPLTIESVEMLASEALGIIEKIPVQILPIVDGEKKIVGVIHIHDLVSAGIKSNGENG
jgi:arabinose-5-phosphate isomerase